MTGPEIIRKTFTTDDGLVLAAMNIRPAKAKALAVINHGIGECFETYDYLIEDLIKIPCEIWIYEMRGHGISQGKRGHASGIDRLGNDLNLFLKFINPDKKIILIAHSLGAAVALNYAIRFGDKKIQTLILNGSGLIIKTDIIMQIKIIIGKLLRKISPSTTMNTGIKNSSLSSFDEYLKKRAKLKNVHQKVSASMGLAIIEEGSQILSEAGRITVPALITHGGADPIANIEGSEKLYQNIGSHDKKFIAYPGLKHEIYNENSSEVFKDLNAWIKKHS